MNPKGIESSMSGHKPRALMSRWVSVGVLLFALGLGVEALCAQEMRLELDPANTRIEFTLAATLHIVHGTFTLKRGTIQFNPSTGSASGRVVVDATSGNSGNKGRDHKMHQEILESERFPEITFTPTRLSGKVDLHGDSTVQVDGTFRLHGTDHPVTLNLPVLAKGSTITAGAHFIIPYIAWGLKNPSTFVLHVNDKVEVNLTAVGKLQQAGQP
jgi:polyisoprenoid-binding protein YceI